MLTSFKPYYDYFTHRHYPASSKPHSLTLHTPLSTFPVLLQGGSILPIRQRVRRSSPLMWQDPFTLVVAASKEGSASGQLYLDDGVTFGHEKGEYVWRQFDYSTSGKRSILKSSDKAHGGLSEATTGVTQYDENNVWAMAVAHVRVEKIVILGLKARPTGVSIEGQSVEWTWEDGVAAASKKEGMPSTLTVKNPGVGVVGGWEVVVE